jgi:hypothetical protein
MAHIAPRKDRRTSTATLLFLRNSLHKVTKSLGFYLTWVSWLDMVTHAFLDDSSGRRDGRGRNLAQELVQASS